MKCRALFTEAEEQVLQVWIQPLGYTGNLKGPQGLRVVIMACLLQTAETRHDIFFLHLERDVSLQMVIYYFTHVPQNEQRIPIIRIKGITHIRKT